MKKDLQEIKEVREKVKSKLENIKNNFDGTIDNVNEVKVLKNSIFEKTSKIFIYNLKKLIQLEGTQKKLAKKIGVSEDLLSKYKSGEAFPSIETLVYVCEVYHISIEKLISLPLTAQEIENLEEGQEIKLDIFEEKYFVYFLVTNIAMEGNIQEGIIEFFGSNVTFKIFANGEVVKYFTGNYMVSSKMIVFNLQSLEDGTTHIDMIRPNINKSKYLGGFAMLMLPSDANSKPCAQKILFSKIKIDREVYYDTLKELLNFHVDGGDFGCVKVSQWEDEHAYNFIRKIM